LAEIDPERAYHGLFVGAGELGDHLKVACHRVLDVDGEIPAGEAIQPAQPGVTFTGFLNQTAISKAFCAADVLVLPSTSETWGLIVNEALASGLPAIVSDACGCAEDLILPLDAKLRVPMGSVEALARAILYAQDNPLPSGRIAAHLANYDFSVTVNTLESLWRELSAS
jgi:glycosyltransferase involved in cell wall biosynthesis